MYVAAPAKPVPYPQLKAGLDLAGILPMKYSVISASFVSYKWERKKEEIPRTVGQRFSKALGGISGMSVTETGTLLQEQFQF